MNQYNEPEFFFHNNERRIKCCFSLHISITKLNNWDEGTQNTHQITTENRYNKEDDNVVKIQSEEKMVYVNSSLSATASPLKNTKPQIYCMYG
jgi:hypothetical protein